MHTPRAVRLHWLPSLGEGLPQAIVLPALSLGWGFAAIIARLLRNNLIDIYQQLRIMARQILPNVFSHIIVIASSAIGWAILTATTLNFLGFGVHLPTPEWGADLAAGRDWLGVA